MGDRPFRCKTTNFVWLPPSQFLLVYTIRKPVVGVVLEMPYLKLYSAIVNNGSWCEGQNTKF